MNNSYWKYLALSFVLPDSIGFVGVNFPACTFTTYRQSYRKFFTKANASSLKLNINHIHRHWNMSRHGVKRARKYWERIGGLLIEEFQVDPKKKNTSKGKWVIDAIIVQDEENRIQTGGTYDLTGKDVIIIQVEREDKGMQFLGEAFTSRESVIRYHPHSIKTVAICSRHDEELYRLCEEFDIEMVVIPERLNE